MEQQLTLTFSEPVKCKNCGTIFPSKHKGKKIEKKFCKEKCRVEYHQEELRKAKAYYKNRDKDREIVS